MPTCDKRVYPRRWSKLSCSHDRSPSSSSPKTQKAGKPWQRCESCRSPTEPIVNFVVRITYSRLRKQTAHFQPRTCAIIRCSSCEVGLQKIHLFFFYQKVAPSARLLLWWKPGPRLPQFLAGLVTFIFSFYFMFWVKLSCFRVSRFCHLMMIRSFGVVSFGES
ncbi:hypothetical protein M758_2G029400 [Ceratodon purpureus]|nr:hypothetical protein M758_2G029400 [Ceratodon purpureus]